MKIILKVIEGPDGGDQFEMDPAKVCRIGRSDSRADFVLVGDPYISGCHCQLEWRDGQVRLSNLSSTNHTFVNDNVITRRKVRDRDVIKVGFTRIQLSIKELSTGSAPTGRNSTVVDIGKLIDVRPVCTICGEPVAADDWEPLGVYCHPECLPESDPVSELPDLGVKNTVIKRLGDGDMCIVYMVAQSVPELSCYRFIAVRRLTKAADSHAGKRFLRGYEIVRCIRHPNLVASLDLRKYDNLPHIFLECAPAGTVHDLLLRSGRPLLPDSAVALIRQVLQGLRVLHENKPALYHRDIKPRNILLRAPGRPEYNLAPVSWEKDSFLAQLTDFDLVKKDSGTGCFTGTGWSMGTYGFASPEAMRDAGRITAVSDLYSVGATFYYLLTGRLPYNSPSDLEIELYYRENENRLKNRDEAYEVWIKQRGCPPLMHVPGKVAVIPLDSAKDGIPPILCQVVNRLLEREPEKRYQSAVEVLGALG